jgi:hypothetical protein
MNIKTLTLAGALGALSLTSFTGCESLKAFFATPTVQKVAVNLGLSAVRLAVPIAFDQARDRINELDNAAFDALEASILSALENAVDADSAADFAAWSIEASALSDAQKVAVIDQLQAELVKQSEAAAGTTAGPTGENYGGPLYDALTVAKSKLAPSTD